MKSKIKPSLTKFLALGLALAWALLTHSAQAAAFSSVASGAYNANATWSGGAANPANGTEDSVTLNNTVTISSALTDAALDDISFGSGNAGILVLGVGDVGTSYSAGTFDFTTGNAILEVSHVTAAGASITDILGASSYKLGNGKTLTLQNGANFAANNSGSITNNGTGTIAGAETINVVSPSQTGRPSLTFAGLFSETSAGSSISKTGQGILALNGGGLYNYSGSTTITSGSLDLYGASSIANSTIILGAADGTSTAMQGSYNGASLIEVKATATGTVTRGGSITVNRHGLNSNTQASGDLSITGITGAANPVTEQFGALTLNTGAGFYATSATSATLGNATLSFASITRSAGTALVVSGGNLGSTAPGAATANSSNFILGNNTGLTGSFVGGGGVLASATTSVTPWLLANGGLGTYDAVNGVQALTTFGSLTTDMGTISQDNVRVSAATSLTANTTVNSLSLNNAASAIDGANTLTVTSGAVNASANGASIGATTPGTLAFGAAEGDISLAGANTFTIGSVITGRSGVNFIYNTSGTIILTGANTFTGVAHSITDQGRANLDLRNSLALQNSTVDLEFNGGNFSFGDTTVAQTAYTFGGLTGVAGFNLTLGNNATTKAPVVLTIGSAGSADTASTVNTLSGALLNGATTAAGGSVIKTGPATQVFAGANTYSGKTTINAGTLKFAKTASLYNSATASWTAANINVASGTTLALNVGGTGEFTAANVNTLLGNISVTTSATTGLQAGAIVGFDTSDAGGTFALVNAIADSTGPNGGAIGLTKLGTGTLFLTNAVNTCSGSTLVLGGTLSLLSSTMGVAAPLTVNNATLALNASSGSSLTVSSVVLQNNSTLSIGYGTLGANPTFTAINDLGTLTAPGTNITINLNQANAGGLSVDQFPLIAYIGTTLPNISNFHLAPLPPGLIANLTNNTVNHSIDLNITSAGQTLTWYGSVNTNWDINTTANWNNGNANYLEYGSAPNKYGDNVTFDDTLYTGGPNPPSTNVNLTTTLHPSSITVNSSLPYSITGVGSLAGSGIVTMNNAGSLFLGTSNNYTGGTVINAGSVIITNDAALGTNSGLVTLVGGTLQVDGNATSSVRPFAVAGGAIGVLTNTTFQLGGSITGTGNLTKNDNGTLVIAGTNSATGATTVSGGTLNVTGLLTNGTGSQITVANSTANATLAITGGTMLANKTAAPSLQAGIINGASGVIRLDSGTLKTASELWLSSANGGYGAFTMNGGTATVGSWLAMSRGGGSGVLNVNGGNLIVAANNLTIGTIVGSGGNNAAATLTGGNTTIAAGGVYVGEISPGVLNLSGSATLTAVGALGIKFGNIATTSSGILNLGGGTIVMPIVQQGPGLYGIFNFNGGTLKASGASATFMQGLPAAYIYGGGAVIDDSGNNLTISQPLLAPQGYGVSSISLTSGGSGYIDTPIVSISGGTGSNASAVAAVSGGAMTGIIITSPGTGYSASDSLTVNFIGGGAGAVSPTIGTVSLAANVSGGLVKLGTGTLTLNGANTYTGTTVVTNGELILPSGYQTTGGLVMADGAIFGIPTSSPTDSVMIGALTMGNVGATTLDLQYGITGNPTSAALVAGPVTVHGASTVRITGTFAVGAFPLLQYSSLSGSFSGITAPRGVAVTLSNDVVHATLYAVVSSISGGGSLTVWTGTNSVAPNLWDINNTTNWLFGGLPATYLQGDNVLFNDSGSGTVTLNTSASPSSMTISNNSVNYTIQGSGAIAGSGGLLMLGTGTATLSLSGDTYTGNTAISNGILHLGSATAIPGGTNAGNVSVNSPGTLDLNGFSPTINGLSGNGNINNSSATVPTLTVGNNNTTVNWGGTINNTGAGIALIKVGSGNAIVTGTNYLRDTHQSQINGGTLLITNGGYFNDTAGQYWIAGAAATTATNIVDGGTLVVNNLLGVGARSATANGTLIVNSGTVQKTGGNNIAVGSGGASGTLIVNGGQVLNSGQLWLGDGATANAYLYLNGGLIQASAVEYYTAAAVPVNYIAYFNGGTLQATASSTNFLQVACYVQAGGLILDDNGYTLTINSAALQEGGGGGLVKKGAGTVYLDVGNSYSGITLVTNGTLAGIGSLAGPVIVAPLGNLGAGDAGTNVGTLTINNNLTLQGNATVRINRDGSPTSDLVGGVANITYGGVLVLSNLSTTTLTTNDTFQLFSASDAVSGNFNNIVGLPGAGLAYSFNPASGMLNVVLAPLSGLRFTANPAISGTSLTISATNAGAGTVYLLTSTNVANPLNTWTPVWTNVLGGSGSFTTNLSGAVNPALQQQFYILSNTNN